MMQKAAVLDNPAAQGPDPQAVNRVLQLVYGRFAGQAACLAAKLGIPDHIAAGATTTERLATALGANPSSLQRFLRALASYGLLTESAAGHWATTPAGDLLRSGAPGSLRDLARLFNTPEHANSWLALEYSVLTGNCAFEHVLGGGAWAYAREHPAFNDAFNAAMSSVAGSVHQAIAGRYDFSGMELLVDVGGGHGRLMSNILQRFPQLRGMVYDMPHVVNGAGAYLAQQGLAGRCQALGGSFFESVPAGADAYIMTAILHDWDDDACVTILRNCRAAMKPSGRVLVGDFVLKPANEPDFGRHIDLEMLVMAGSGRERTKEEFQALFRRAGLALAQIIPLPAGNNLIEAIPQ